MISPHEQFDAFQKYFPSINFPDTVEGRGELLATDKALKRIPSKDLSLDLQLLCDRIRTKVGSLILECRECRKNLENANKELVQITAAKERLIEMQNTFDNLRAEHEQELCNISKKGRRESEIKAQMDDLEKKLRTVETLSQWSSDRLRERTNVCTRVAQETMFYKSNCDALSSEKSLLISDIGAAKEIIKNVNDGWAELIRQVRDVLEAQIIAYNSSNMGELMDSLNHTQILAEQNSPVSYWNSQEKQKL